MAIINTINNNNNSGSGGGGANSSNSNSTLNGNVSNNKRRASQLTQQLTLTNCQLIDCVANNHSSSTTATTTTTTTNNTTTSGNGARYQARNVCWNTTGSLLAVGCSDGMIRFWNPLLVNGSDSSSSSNSYTNNNNNNNSGCKEVGSINTVTAAGTANSGGPPIIAATFHPTSDPILCSMTAGSGTIRLWDVRSSSTTGSTGTSTTNTATNTTSSIASSLMSSCSTTTSLSPLPIIVAVEWNPIQTHIIACTTHDGTVSIYDTRKFTTATSNNPNATTMKTTPTALVQKIQFPHVNDRIESCIFDQTSGEYILAGVTNRDHTTSHCSGMGYVKVHRWDTTTAAATTTKEHFQSTSSQNHNHHQQQWHSYPAHAGPIYTIASNRGGTKVATGGSDAVVGIWDVVASSDHTTSYCCTSTISNRTKFIRAVAFSQHHAATATTEQQQQQQQQLLAIATEEDVIELIDCTSSSSNRCSTVGLASLSNTGTTSRRSSSNMNHVPGAEDISFHPSIPYLLACARTTDISTPSGVSCVTFLKLTLSAS